MNKEYTNPDFGYGCSRNYFSDQALPSLVELKRETIHHMTSYSQKDGMELVYIKKGNGILIVNNMSYSFQEGDCFLFHFYHFHRLMPDQDLKIELIRCSIGYNSYLFMYNNPYLNYNNINLQNDSLVCNFRDTQKITIEGLWEELEAALKSEEPYHDYSSFFLFIEIWGRFNRYAFQSHLNRKGQIPD